MLQHVWVFVKNLFVFSVTYVRYVYYGLKQRIVALFSNDLGILGFLKSLFKIPFESYHFTVMEMNT